MNNGDHFYCSRGGRKEKIGNLNLAFGKDLQHIDSATAGHVVALTKLDGLHIGDTLTLENDALQLAPVPYPTPMAQLAVRPVSRADETKISEGLRKLAEESPTFTVIRDAMTNEQVASGASSLHLDICFRRLKDRYGIEVETSVARVPYRECITKPSDGHYRHKKQSGGRGQFGEVFLKVLPAPAGSGLVFNWDIVGGSIPSNFRPAIEKGIREKMGQGVIAGYPILDITVSVYDGKFHDVDSSEAAFKIAGGRAFSEGVLAAKPVLLEPMVDAEIVVPSDNLGDISGDLNTRRGRINGMEGKGTFQVIRAVAPKAEMAEYPRILTSLTSGEGSFSFEECGYEQVPANVQAQIVAAYKPHAEDD
jgi:elongation factor G